MRNISIGKQPAVRALPYIIEALGNPEGSENASLMNEFNQAVNIVCQTAMAGGGKLSPNLRTGLNELLEFFANKDGISELSDETVLEPEFFRSLNPCQKAIWAAGCVALAEREKSGSDT